MVGGVFVRRTGALVKKSVITSGGASLIIDLISTPTRRGVPFTRVRRRGLCSMSGRYPYGIGNPPTLRRSSFPQRASRPAGGPIPQNTLGALPQDPCRWLCWIRIDLRREPKNNPYCAQNRSQGSHGRICPFPPPPFPMAGKGPGWAGNYRPRVTLSGC